MLCLIRFVQLGKLPLECKMASPPVALRAERTVRSAPNRLTKVDPATPYHSSGRSTVRSGLNGCRSRQRR